MLDDYFRALDRGLAWSLRHGLGDPPQPDGEALVLRHPVGVAVAGGATLLIGAVVVGAFYVLMGGVQRPGEEWRYLGMAGLFVVPGVWSLAAYWREWARLRPDGIEARGLLAAAPVRMRWAEVERVSFGRLSLGLVFRAADGRTARVSGFFRGADLLPDLVEAHLPDRGGPEAAAALRAYRRQVHGLRDDRPWTTDADGP